MLPAVLAPVVLDWGCLDVAEVEADYKVHPSVMDGGGWVDHSTVV